MARMLAHAPPRRTQPARYKGRMVMGEVHVAEGQVAKLIERAGQGEDIVLSLDGQPSASV